MADNKRNLKDVRVKVEQKVKIERLKKEEEDAAMDYKPYPIFTSMKQEDDKKKIIKIKHDPDTVTSPDGADLLTIEEQIQFEHKASLKLEAECAAMRVVISELDDNIRKLDRKKQSFEAQKMDNQSLLDEAIEKKNAQEEKLSEMRQVLGDISGTGAAAGNPLSGAMTLESSIHSTLVSEVTCIKDVIKVMDQLTKSPLFREDVAMTSVQTQTGLAESEWATLNPEPHDIRPTKK